jgi:hypothetical protein
MKDLFSGENKYQIINTHDYCEDEKTFPAYHSPTLKDIAIILCACCGCGVGHQLINELSEKLKIDDKKVGEAFWEIIREYSELSDDEAMKRWEQLGR